MANEIAKVKSKTKCCGMKTTMQLWDDFEVELSHKPKFTCISDQYKTKETENPPLSRNDTETDEAKTETGTEDEDTDGDWSVLFVCTNFEDKNSIMFMRHK